MARDSRTRAGAKDPWGRAARTARTAARGGVGRVGLSAHVVSAARTRAKVGDKQRGSERMSGVDFSSARRRQARTDMLALKPYWGKPTVRNFRGSDGNVGIIRSPVRAIALLDNQRRPLVAQAIGRRAPMADLKGPPHEIFA